MIRIENDADLERVAAEVSERLQAMQDYTGRTSGPRGVIRFPRGYLMGMAEIRRHYAFIGSSIRRSNIAYTVSLIQVMTWLLTRTDIALTARSMVCKLLIVLRASVAETMLADALDGGKHARRRGSFKQRTERLERQGVISHEVRQALDRLWAQRNHIHLDHPGDAEHLKYGDEDARRARDAVLALHQQLGARTAPRR
jgi:hypothetical protein